MQAKATKDGIQLTDNNENGLVEWKKLLTAEQARALMSELEDALFDHVYWEE